MLVLFGESLQEEWMVYGAHLCKIISVQFMSKMCTTRKKGKSIFFYLDRLGSLSCFHSEWIKWRPVFINWIGLSRALFGLVLD
jgi:hypothetical protein